MRASGRKILFAGSLGLFILLLSFGGAMKAFAQTGGGSVSGGGSGGFNIGGLAGVGISCAFGTGLIGDALESIGTAIGGLFGGSAGGGIGAGAGSVAGDLATGDVGGALGGAANTFNDSTSIPVKDPVVRDNTDATKERVQINNAKEYCLDKITREAAVQVMDIMTLAIVDWINTGFDGDAFYPLGQGEFWTAQAVGEIDGFLAFYANPDVIGDFAEAVGQAIYENLQRSTYERFQNSLAIVLAHGTPTEFHADFNVGGWAGYTTLFEPQNNPFGSYLMASDEIGKRINGYHMTRIENLNKQLDLSGGFFDQQVCSLPGTNNASDEYIDKTDPRHSPPGSPPTIALLEFLGIDPYMVGPLDPDDEAEIEHYQLLSTCLKWRTQTPGYVLANTLTDQLGSPLRQLELTDEFQENIALILDALLNQIINPDVGLAGSDSTSNPGNGNALIAQVNGLLPGQTGNSTPLPGAINGSGTPGTPDFEPGIIAIQQAYIDQAPLNIAKIIELMTAIRVLDYCVPGPYPLWYDAAVDRLEEAITTIAPASSGNAADDQAYYADLIHGLTGIDLDPTPFITTHSDFADFLIYTFTAYRDAMYDTGNGGYSINQAPPSMRPTLYNLFNQLDGLDADANNINDTLVTLTNLMPQLLVIQGMINDLPLAIQNDPNSAEMQNIADIFADAVSGGGLVNQSDVDSLFAEMNVLNFQLNQANTAITNCVTETDTVAPPYGFPNERIDYPLDLTGYPLWPTLSTLPPNNIYYLEDSNTSDQFGDGANEIDLSGFHGSGLDIPPTDLDIFQLFLGIY